MRVIVCGSRQWTNSRLVFKAMEDLADKHPDAEVIHGDARGADRMAGSAAAALGLKVIAVPAEWDQFGKAAGPMRNKEMLGMAPDLVLAFRLPGVSKGTDHMIDIAARSGVRVVVIDVEGRFTDVRAKQVHR